MNALFPWEDMERANREATQAYLTLDIPEDMEPAPKEPGTDRGVTIIEPTDSDDVRW